MALEHRPLATEELTVGAAKLAGPTAPAPVKLMAARGMAPGATAPDLVTALYQLTFDGSPQVAQTARKTLSELPDTVFRGCLDRPLHPLVLDALAQAVKRRSGLLEMVLLNRAVADETFAWLARELPEKEMEIIARNEQRLLRHPALIEALYLNPATRMSTANRCVELAVRNGVALNLAAFKEMAHAIGLTPKEKDPMDQALVDEQMDHNFASVCRLGEDLDAEAAVAAADGELDAEDRAKARRRVEKLSISEKIRLATLGNMFHRAILLRDSNRMVMMAAMKGPGVGEMEVVRISNNPQAPEEVLRYIANNREWVKLYQVKANLTSNPKTPLAIALQLLPHLRPKELRGLSRSKNIPAALRTAAQARIAKKDKGK